MAAFAQGPQYCHSAHSVVRTTERMHEKIQYLWHPSTIFCEFYSLINL